MVWMTKQAGKIVLKVYSKFFRWLKKTALPSTWNCSTVKLTIKTECAAILRGVLSYANDCQQKNLSSCMIFITCKLMKATSYVQYKTITSILVIIIQLVFRAGMK